MGARFQSFWFGDSLPLYIQLAAKSFIDHGHEYLLYTYDPIEVPAGVALRDASEILPKSRVFFYGDQAGVGRGSVSAFSNLFRYHLLCKHGGWWVDADVICLSESVPNSDVFIGWEYETLIGTAILRLTAGHALAEELVSASEAAGAELGWGTTGPVLLTRLVHEHNLLHIIQPQAIAYPVQSVDALHLFLPSRCEEVSERIASKPFLHMWNEIQRRAVILPYVCPPPGSILAKILAFHGFDLGKYPAYTNDQMNRLNENYYASAAWSHAEAENAEVTRLKQRVQNLERLLQDCEDTRNELYLSTSWRITKPMRELKRVLTKRLHG